MVLSDDQLAALLRKQGVSAGDAAYLVATAHPESHADPAEVQQGVPYDQQGWGIWQITPGNSVPSAGINNALLNPQANAKAAAAKLKSQGLDAWTTYTSGAYQPYFAGAKAAVAKVYGMPLSQVDQLASSAGHGAPDAGSSNQDAQTAQLTSTVAGPQGMLQETGTLLHGTAVVLDRAFALFAPGQGWRIVFATGAAAAGAGAVKTYRDDGQGDGQLPLAILLTGVSIMAAFMALRPWPQADGQPIKPGAYTVDVLKGEPPPAGPGSIPAGEVELTEAGLATLVGLWAAGKVAGGIGSAANAAAGLGGILGKVWGWVKGLGSAGEEAAAAGADV